MSPCHRTSGIALVVALASLLPAASAVALPSLEHCTFWNNTAVVCYSASDPSVGVCVIQPTLVAILEDHGMQACPDGQASP